MAFKTQFCALESKRGGCVSRTVRRWSTILQQKSQNRSIQLLRWCLKNSWIANATVVQSSRRRRRLIGRRSRVQCATAQLLARVGCCFRAVDVIDLDMVDVSIDFVLFDGFREGESVRWRQDRSRWEGWTSEKGVSTWCHESSWIFYGSSKDRGICAEHLSTKTDIPLFQNSCIMKTIIVSTCIYLKNHLK